MSPCCSFPSRRNTRFCLLPLAPLPPKGNVWVRCRVCAREIEASVWLRSVRNMLFRRCLDLDRLSEVSSGSSMISLWRARAGRSWLKDTVLARRDDCENNTITYYITKTTHVFRNPSIISLRNERAVMYTCIGLGIEGHFVFRLVIGSLHVPPCSYACVQESIVLAVSLLFELFLWLM